MPFSIPWNENDPADTDLANLLGDDIRDLKEQIRERVSVEHFFPISDNATTGYHRQGSARPFFQAAPPVNNPDAPGAIWIRDTDNQIFRDNGATWDPLGFGLPPGVIVMWSGSLATIPSGWKLCDGTSGTPDMRDRFVRGAPPAVDPGVTGGNDTHSHNGITGVNTGTTFAAAGAVVIPLDPHVHAFTTDPADNLPAYFTVAYIMKA